MKSPESIKNRGRLDSAGKRRRVACRPYSPWFPEEPGMSTALHVQPLLRIVGDHGTVLTDDEILRIEKSGKRLEAPASR